jgi:nitrate reductase molybdenum cofactor assembly chaperone NarJ/NarW
MSDKTMRLTLRVLARLLSYPDAELREHLFEMSAALLQERALGADRLAELSALIARLERAPGLETEAAYVEMFDRGHGTALHLFEHVHGDSRDRGAAMVDLLQTYEAAGLSMGPSELPDHLTVVLEYASTQPPAQARQFLQEMAHILRAIFTALLRRQSPYASALAAVLDLAGEKAEAVNLPDEPALDESWEEPAVFGGCDRQGQARPGQPQPIRIMKRPAARDAASTLSGVRP